MYDDEDSGPDEFDKLDQLVEFAEKSMANGRDDKYYATADMVELVMEEVPESDVRIYKQAGGSWVIEVKYKGIKFITIMSADEIKAILSEDQVE